MVGQGSFIGNYYVEKIITELKTCSSLTSLDLSCDEFHLTIFVYMRKNCLSSSMDR